jgi:hypothetical protein
MIDMDRWEFEGRAEPFEMRLLFGRRGSSRSWRLGRIPPYSSSDK